MTTSSITSATATCPSWCTSAHDTDTPTARVHEGSPVTVSPAVSVVVSQVDGHDATPGLLLRTPADFVTEAEAHELGMTLVRLADELRRNRLAGR